MRALRWVARGGVLVVLWAVCLCLWWAVLPSYTWCLGHITAPILTYGFGEPIEGVRAHAEGFLNTGTMLAFRLEGREIPLPIAYLATNVAPFLALVLCTSGLSVRQRLSAIGIGVGILVIGHIVWIVLAFHWRAEMAKDSRLAEVIAHLLISLPFLLWIVLAYWNKLMDAVSGVARPQGGVAREP